MKTDYQPKSKWSIDDENTSIAKRPQRGKNKKVGRWVLIGIIIVVLIMMIDWLAATPHHVAQSPSINKKPVSNMVSIPLTLPQQKA